MDETCTNCGTSLPDGASFCPECGTATAAASAPLPPVESLRSWPSEPPPYPPIPVTTPPGPPPPWPGTPPPALLGPEPAALERNTLAGVVGAMGALVLGVSSFLAWAQITLTLVTERTQTVSGWDWFDNGVESGPLLGLLALVAAALAGLLLSRVAPLGVRLAVVAVGALSLGVAVHAISDILQRQSDVQAVGNVAITFEYGMGLVIVGALIILGAGLLADHRPPEHT